MLDTADCQVDGTVTQTTLVAPVCRPRGKRDMDMLALIMIATEVCGRVGVM